VSAFAIEARHLSKRYRLGTVRRRMLAHELESRWARWRRREDPHSYVHDGERDRLPRPRDFWALSDVSFTVQRGDAVGIMGVNGSGKSTLLKILSRITAPTQGTATTRGRVASLLEVGTGFHLELSGRENVHLNGSILGMSRREIDERYDSIVAFAEVEQFMATPVKRYSSGMRLRLAFAVAAHLDPDILILDEVLSVGDAKFQEKCLARIEATKHAGTTVLYVSHTAQSVIELCNRGIVLSQGRIICDGGAREAVDAYLGALDLDHPERQIEGAADCRRGEIIGALSALLARRLSSGHVVTACPVETSEGVQRVDAGWISENRRRMIRRTPAYSSAPDVAVLVPSASRSVAESQRIASLLFHAGASEVWQVSSAGQVRIDLKSGQSGSSIVPGLGPAFALDLD